MSPTASGTFSVDISPRPPDPDTARLEQMQIRKRWSGEIEAAGWGLMISGGDAAAGSAGYVAMEFLEGRVGNLVGGLALQQFGTMSNGKAHQVYEVVPGSGTGDLAGISGTLRLDVADGTHHYALSYELPTPAG
jgi:hypothetical protein